MLGQRATTHIRQHTQLLLSACVFVAALLLPACEAAAEVLQPTLRIPIQTLRAAGIAPESIRSSIYLPFEETPAAMNLADRPAAKILNLSGVQFSGGHNPGVWLRTQCNPKKRAFILEECRGSVCFPTTAARPSTDRKNHRSFTGEFGSYQLSRSGFEKQKLEGASFDSGLCAISWPTWALSARALARNSELAFPKSMLLLQTAQKILLFNTLDGQIWNSIPWDESRGVFTHASVSSDGRLLLKNNALQALFIDFSQARYISMNQGTVSWSRSGLNNLFSSEARLLEDHLKIEIPDINPALVSLGGFWWSQGFLTWNDLQLALVTKVIPLVRPYPQSQSLLAALWSEQGGIEKDYILLRASDRLELHSSENGGASFVKVKTLRATAEHLSHGQMFIHPEFATRLLNSGEIEINTAEQFSFELKTFDNTAAVQSGLDLITYKKHADNPNCRVTIYAPRTTNNGWVQNHVLPNVPCSTGVGRNGHMSGLVEITPREVKIYLIRQP